MRFTISERCEDEWIVCTIDKAASETVLLIVSGGNEIAVGPQRSMARLARLIADKGWSVIRFDRRGVGDSGGVNGGFRSSAPDLAAAQRIARHIGARQVVAFGNCDAAAALAIHPLATSCPANETSVGPAPIVSRVLTNPWLGQPSNEMLPPAAVKRYYRRRLLDPDAWRALVRGKVDLRALARGVGQLVAQPSAPSTLAGEIVAGLSRTPLPTRIVVSRDDMTGSIFAAGWRSAPFRELHGTVVYHMMNTASHGFTETWEMNHLADILEEALREADASLPPRDTA